ncbi:hypothetical protein ACFVTY_35475 [Streptomyces sp. NPDC058067]|uniref:hypothetical protein n=1 Tax=Streptomyces sp. NPDC058067 TaxID=3346324 RepID=UPI0036E80EFE
MNDSHPDPDQVPEQAAGAAEVPPAAAGPSYEPAAPAPLGVPRTPTGDADVDAGLDRLADVDHLTADGHIEVYEDVHRGLRNALTALDARPQPSSPYEHRS